MVQMFSWSSAYVCGVFNVFFPCFSDAFPFRWRRWPVESWLKRLLRCEWNIWSWTLVAQILNWLLKPVCFPESTLFMTRWRTKRLSWNSAGLGKVWTNQRAAFLLALLLFLPKCPWSRLNPHISCRTAEPAAVVMATLLIFLLLLLLLLLLQSQTDDMSWSPKTSERKQRNTPRWGHTCSQAAP